MRGHRYANKRMGKRLGNGRFAKLTFRDVFGVDANTETKTCPKCGHQWMPVVAWGTCPECGTRADA